MREIVAVVAMAVACGSRAVPVHVVQGLVLERENDHSLVIDHEAVPGLMNAMIMPFQMREGVSAGRVQAGDTIVARLSVIGGRYLLDDIRITGHAEVPASYVPRAGGAIRPTAILPPFRVTLSGGDHAILGQGQGQPTLLAFFDASCPQPAFCTEFAERFLALQTALEPGRARLLLLSRDTSPEAADHAEAFEREHGFNTGLLRVGTLAPEALSRLEDRAGLKAAAADTWRVMVLDTEGQLIERYDDDAWRAERLLSQLRTSLPRAGAPDATPQTDAADAPVVQPTR